MSVVVVNAITVPPERVEEFEQRFASRAGEVEGQPGFEDFQLLKPTDGRDVFLVYTRWASREAFEGWMASPAFQHGHRQHQSSQEAGGGPVGSASEVWSFDVIQHESRGEETA